MDPPKHTLYRRVIEPYFAREKLDAFEPVCRDIASILVQVTLTGNEIELITDFALPFAVGAQCAFLGWPATLHEPLVQWLGKNREATIAQDRQILSELAHEFEGYINQTLKSCQQTWANPGNNITASLMHEKVHGRELSHDEIASILRNWIAGEIGTTTSSIGIIMQYLAEYMDLQKKLRTDQSLLPEAIGTVVFLKVRTPFNLVVIRQKIYSM